MVVSVLLELDTLFPAPLKLRPYGAIQICLLLLLLLLLLDHVGQLRYTEMNIINVLITACFQCFSPSTRDVNVVVF